MITLTPQALVKLGSLEQSDYRQIKECRGEHNKLGFCYQLLFVKIINRFPAQAPFEIIDDMLTFASLQINISPQKIKPYQKRQATISEHQTKIKIYLGLRKLDEVPAKFINSFIFTEASFVCLALNCSFVKFLTNTSHSAGLSCFITEATALNKKSPRSWLKE